MSLGLEGTTLEGVAIIGLAGRFPGAVNAVEFWENLVAGIESIERFTAGELEVSHADPALSKPNYVRARSILRDVDLFDPEFFGIYPAEAEVMDPQHRIFLECCWEAFENAGYDPATLDGLAGVFAGCSPNTYFLTQLCADPKFARSFAEAYQVGHYSTMLGTIADTLATRVSYKLDLRGPSVTVLSACSTSLVAVAQACQSLLTYQCDVALAGAISITLPQKRGYLHQEGGMVSADGHCRTFDEAASGTVFGSGAGVVLLKRLEDATADRDHIYAVIRGSAINNDGAAKVGFTAPSVDGQAQVIAMAQAAAGVSARSIEYVETHGTATPLGDPIELEALTRAFRRDTPDKSFCALGTAKTNVGHLDVAAGVTGLIKTALSFQHSKLPPVLHFHKPNPRLKLDSSPFFVNSELRDWPRRPGKPRRAGVSAFGVGGTNAHVVLEEAPLPKPDVSKRSTHVLTLSARSATALAKKAAQLADALSAQPDLSLPDVAYTLACGRRTFPFRWSVAADTTATAVERLRQWSADTKPLAPAQDGAPVCFLFPGQGSQHVNMGRELLETEPVFRDHVTTGVRLLAPYLGVDLGQILYPAEADTTSASSQLLSTALTQPALFIVEYALAKLWEHWGVKPVVMIGHSLGEFVAACLAGVFSFEDGLRMVAERGRLMETLPPGGMRVVHSAAPDVEKLLGEPEFTKLSLAAVNAPQVCVVAGDQESLSALDSRLASQKIASQPLATSRAFHSCMVDPILDPLRELIRTFVLQPPQTPIVSSVTGELLTSAEATDPEYWVRHCRRTVQFSPAFAHATQAFSFAAILEVGPGTALRGLARAHAPKARQQDSTGLKNTPLLFASPVFGSLGQTGRSENSTPANSIYQTLGQLWTVGASIKWKALYECEERHKVPLPTYPFERKRYWVDRGQNTETEPGSAVIKQAEPLGAPVLAPLASSAIPIGAADRSSTSIEPATNFKQNTMNSGKETAISRSERYTRGVVALISDLSGVEPNALTPEATFLELGFDSLFLTQVSQAVNGQYGVSVTFRQLLDQLSTPASIGSFLAETLPPDTIAEPAPEPTVENTSAAPIAQMSAAPAVEAAVLNSNATGIELVMREQLQAMTRLIDRQLELLAQGRSATPVNVPPVSAAPASVPSGAPTVAAPPLTAPAAPASPQEFKAFGPYKPVQRNVGNEVTQAQRQYVAEFTRKFNHKTAQSKAYAQRYRKVLADPRAVSGFRQQWKELVYPLVTERSKGSRLWDLDGNEYLDLLNGFGPIAFGHKPDFVVDALKQQLELGIEIGPQAPLAGPTAELLCELTGMDRAMFCNTGSEAVMAAFRIARTVTSRKKIVLFSGAYHGMFDEVLVRHIGAAQSLRSGPIAPGITNEAVSNIVVLEYGSLESLATIRKLASELAAVIVEPVQSRHPSLQPVEFLRELRAITETSGTALIFDEVVTGFRTHPGGAQALFGIRADLATYGKVLAGGMPIGAVAGQSRFMDALDGGEWQFGDDSFPEVGVTFFAGTFVRHPLAMAAAHAVLLHIKKNGFALQDALTARTKDLVSRINSVFDRYSIPCHAESFGSVFYFSVPSSWTFGSLLHYHLRDNGIFILEGFPCFLTTALTEADIETIIGAFERSLEAMASGDLLPVSDQSKPTEAVPSQPIAVPQPVLPEPTEAPLTEAQLEVWLAAQLSPEASCAFNECFSIKLEGPVREDVLVDSLQALVNRHQALRATISEEGETVRFAPFTAFPVPVQDLTQLDAATREERVEQVFAEEATHPFSMTEGPLFRARLVRLSSKETLLVMTGHHIVCDGWSTNVLLTELAQLYSAATTGGSCFLTAAKPFGRYALEQSAFKDSAEWKSNEAFWLAQYKSVPPVLSLPTDHPRPTVKGFGGGTYRTKIELGVTNAVRSAGAKQGCTLFVTLLSAFETLLFRLTGQDDLAVGIPSAAQSQQNDGALVGHGVNFLPLRATRTDGMTFAALLKETRSRLLDAYEHQNYTYGTLVRQLNIPRDPARLPLVEVQFNLEKVGSDASFTDLKITVDSGPKHFTNFDLFLNIVESPAGLTLDCDYNAEVFEQDTVASWMRHFEMLLRSAAERPTLPLMQLPILSEAERHELLYGRNQTEAAYPQTDCVHDLIAAQAIDHPQEIAAVFENERVTYELLEQKSNQLARFLETHGAHAGTFVGVYMERSLEMLIAVLATLKCGAAYIPLDPVYPKQRIDFILEETAAPVVLTQSHLASHVEASGRSVVSIDSSWAVIERQSSGPITKRVPQDTLAYLIYTSGSTGKPKGVEISHRALVNFLKSMKRIPGMTEHDRLLAVTTLSFDIAGLELFLPLITGGRVVIAGADAVIDGRRLKELIETEGITLMQATPSTWRLLLDAEWTPTPALRMLCGGEALPRELADQLTLQDVELWNMYGPTETTIWSAVSLVESGPGPVRLGSPIANTQFYVLDAVGEPLPLGVAGELYISGDSVADGYFKRPELTAQKFISNSFIPGGRLFRTGDLVRALPDGSYDFLGRCDDQVKLRGYRIELGEIETALASYPGVVEAVVVAREDNGSKRLVGYYTVLGRDATLVDPGQLRTFAREKLPAYMLPAALIPLAELPRTPNGKIDRKALPAPDFGASQSTALRRPETPSETKLAEICCEVLELAEVGTDSNLFELGADSIQIFKIVARANRADIPLTVQMVLRQPTIQKMAEAAQVNPTIMLRAALGRIVPVSREVYRLNTGQTAPSAANKTNGTNGNSRETGKWKRTRE